MLHKSCGSVIVIREHIDDNSYTAGSVTFERTFHEKFTVQFAGSFFDRFLNLVVRHIDAFCPVNRMLESHVIVGISAALAAIVITRAYFVKLAALFASCAAFLPAIVPCLPILSSISFNQYI